MAVRAAHGVCGMCVVLVCAGVVAAQSAQVAGTVRDETGGVLPGVVVELTSGADPVRRTATDAVGEYRFDGLTPGRSQLVFLLVNFAISRREVVVDVAGKIVRQR